MAGPTGPSATMSVRDALTAFVTASPLDMSMLDREGRLLAVSDSDVAAAGLSRETLLGARIADLFGEAAEPLAKVLAPSAIEKPVKLPPARIVNPVGELQWIETSCTPWRDEAGAVGGLICINQNITSEQRALAELGHTEALLDAVVDSIPSILVVQDYATGGPVRVNRATEAFFGRSREDILAPRSPPLTAAETQSRHWEKVRQAATQGGMLAGEEVILNGAGQSRIVRNRRKIIEGRDGARHVLTVAEDITEARRAEAALQAALHDAEAANRAKSAFLASVSHEIRTPLNGVLGMAQVMAHGELTEEQRRRLEVIRQSGEALLAILNDILDLSKIEAGKLDIEAVPFDLAKTVRAACTAFAGTAQGKGLALTVDTAGLEGLYLGDPTRIRQVVSNLVSNAVKFTESGEVGVTAQPSGDVIRITVSDTGPGMDEGVLGRLFEKFVQADSSTTRRFGGTGLGLAICRELAELMGGSITAASSPGEGSTFTVSLALRRADDAAAGPPGRAAEAQIAATPAASGLRVLAAEDNEVNQLVLRALLQQIGIEPLIVDNGLDAVAAWAAQDWDLILMDVQMPRMDGPTATQVIREREGLDGRARTPILALTANAMSHQTQDYAAAGMDGFVAKPIEVRSLFAAIEAAVAPAAPGSAQGG